MAVVGGGAGGTEARVEIDPIKAAPKIAALDLGDASRVVVNGRRIVRGGHKRLAARGRKGVLVRKPEAIRRSFHGQSS